MSVDALENYELQGLLGEGGIGQVYAAQDKVLGRRVAIKALRPELSRDRSFVERFYSEAKSLANLNHTNITTLYALHVEGSEAFMVMELVHGQTLEALLARVGRLTLRDSLAILAQAVPGLRYAHRRGIIHRDLKPANLMLTDDGVIKIMDFGIARVQGSQHLTRVGEFCGTFVYASPEQIRGEDVDERSDLYSLAIVLYRMLAGTAPFTSDNEYALMTAQLQTPPPPLTGRVPDLDAGTEAALMRALAKRPEDRFASVEEFGRALGAMAMRGESIDILQQLYAHAFAAEDPEATRIAGSPRSPVVEATLPSNPALRRTADWQLPASLAPSTAAAPPPSAPGRRSVLAESEAPGQRSSPPGTRAGSWLWLAGATVAVPLLLGAGYLVWQELPALPPTSDPPPTVAAVAPEPEPTLPAPTLRPGAPAEAVKPEPPPPPAPTEVVGREPPPAPPAPAEVVKREPPPPPPAPTEVVGREPPPAPPALAEVVKREPPQAPPAPAEAVKWEPPPTPAPAEVVKREPPPAPPALAEVVKPERPPLSPAPAEVVKREPPPAPPAPPEVAKREPPPATAESPRPEPPPPSAPAPIEIAKAEPKTAPPSALIEPAKNAAPPPSPTPATPVEPRSSAVTATAPPPPERRERPSAAPAPPGSPAAKASGTDDPAAAPPNSGTAAAGKEQPASASPSSAPIAVATKETPAVTTPPPALGPRLPTAQPKPEGEPDLQGKVTGAKRLDEIEIGARWIKIYGIVDRARGAKEAEHVRALVRYLKPSQNHLVCYRKGADTYRCYSDGQDIARLALQDGIVQPAPNAPAEYRSLHTGRR